MKATDVNEGSMVGMMKDGKLIPFRVMKTEMEMYDLDEDQIVNDGVHLRMGREVPHAQETTFSHDGKFYVAPSYDDSPVGILLEATGDFIVRPKEIDLPWSLVEHHREEDIKEKERQAQERRDSLNASPVNIKELASEAASRDISIADILLDED